MFKFDEIIRCDKEIADAMTLELNRQRDKIELIASENFVSKAVMAAMGSHLTNKYAEGYPEKRYYGGCECVDIVESLAIERAKKLFGADHANVQPHSGAQANFAVYNAVLDPGDTILGMNLAHGGHLTHGSPVNMSGKLYKIVPYGVREEDCLIDYDNLQKIAMEVKPKLIVAGASAYPRIIDFEKFGEIARECGAYLMVDMAHIAGLIAAGLHPSPVPYADFVTSTTHKTLRGPRGGLILCKNEHQKIIDKSVFPGTQGGPLMHVIAAKAICLKEAADESFITYQKNVLKNANQLANSLKDKGFTIVSGTTENHLLLVDLRSKNITGRDAEHRLDEIGITCNKNAIPFDTQKPNITSGIRLGTPAVTSRGLNEEDMIKISEIIDITFSDNGNTEKAKDMVKDVLMKYPLYAD